MFFILNSKIDALYMLTNFFCLICVYLISTRKNFFKLFNFVINLFTFFIFLCFFDLLIVIRFVDFIFKREKYSLIAKKDFIFVEAFLIQLISNSIINK